MRRPLLFLSLAFAAGCLVGVDVGRRAGLALLALAAASLLLALLAPKGRELQALVAAAVALGAAAAGLEAAAWGASPLGRWIGTEARAGEPVRLRGVAAAPVPADGVKHSLVLEVAEVGLREPLASAPGCARLAIGGDAARVDLAEGDRLEVTATLDPPRPARSPGAFDPEAWARGEGYHGLGYCKSPLLVKVEGPCALTGPRCAASRAREWARGRLRQHVPEGAPQGLVRAMVLGDRSTLDEATSESFRRAGTYHVLALSGAQVALVAGILIAAGKRAELAPLPLALVVASVLAGYAVLVGADVPVSRAAVTGIVIVLGRSLDLDADLANLLGPGRAGPARGESGRGGRRRLPALVRRDPRDRAHGARAHANATPTALGARAAAGRLRGRPGGLATAAGLPFPSALAGCPRPQPGRGASFGGRVADRGRSAAGERAVAHAGRPRG